MATIGTYKDLTVWQKSIDLCEKIYKITEAFPKSEQFGISNQIRRNAVSVPSNIAEGYRRGHRAEYVQFLRVSYGSAAELETQLIIARNIGYMGSKDYEILNDLLLEILKMLNKLISTLKSKK